VRRCKCLTSTQGRLKLRGHCAQSNYAIRKHEVFQPALQNLGRRAGSFNRKGVLAQDGCHSQGRRRPVVGYAPASSSCRRSLHGSGSRRGRRRPRTNSARLPNASARSSSLRLRSAVRCCPPTRLQSWRQSWPQRRPPTPTRRASCDCRGQSRRRPAGPHTRQIDRRQTATLGDARVHASPCATGSGQRLGSACVRASTKARP
jgi:hypothetical protein